MSYPCHPPGQPDTPSVLIYRNDLLPESETFIRSQAESMRRYHPSYVGLRRLPSGLELDQQAITVASGSSAFDRLRRLAFLQTGWSRGFRRNLKRGRHSLLHAHFATDATASLPLSRWLRLPLVVSLHGYDVTTHDEAHRQTRLGCIYLRRRRHLLETASAFICISRFIQNAALRRGFPSEKLIHLPIGVDVDYFKAPGACHRDNTVLFVGRLVEKKGCAHLIRAMARLEARLPDVRLVIVGDGPLRHELEGLARERLRNFLFLGSQPPHVVKHWMLRSRVFSVPSVTARNGDTEGLGLVFCEAHACGLPAVSTRSGGIPEIVHHGITGMLAEEHNDDQLAEYLLFYLESAERWRDASLAARARVIEHFNLRTQTDKLEIHYDQLIAAHARAAGARLRTDDRGLSYIRAVSNGRNDSISGEQI